MSSNNKGKIYIPKVKALLDIPNIVKVGEIYPLKPLKKAFPYIDFYNKEYFENVFDSANFAVGDKVRYVGHTINLPLKKNTYMVSKVIPKLNNDMVSFSYEISSSFSTYIVNENEIAEVYEKWIISFSQNNKTVMPAIHRLDFYGYENKIKGTWKEMFTFDTFEEAEYIAKAIAKYGIKQMVDYINSNLQHEY